MAATGVPLLGLLCNGIVTYFFGIFRRLSLTPQWLTEENRLIRTLYSNLSLITGNGIIVKPTDLLGNKRRTGGFVSLQQRMEMFLLPVERCTKRINIAVEALNKYAHQDRTKTLSPPQSLPSNKST